MSDLALGPDWREMVLRIWNDTAVSYREASTVPDLFDEQVDRAPDATALLDRDTVLSYRALDERANRLAHLLRRRGVAPGTAVALLLDRSAASVVAILAVLKAGGAYVPLDALHPAERLAFIVRDTGAALLLTERALAGHAPAGACALLILDQLQAELAAEPCTRPTRAAVRSSDRAYIMYTSGSTGTPKGVEATHHGINRLVCAVDYVRLGPGATVLHAAPLAFDASTFEIWGGLLTGGCCAVHAERLPTADTLGHAIAAYGVTTMWLTSGLFNAVVDEAPARLRGLRHLIVGGEALSVRHVRRALAELPGTQLVNGYGPTETTTFAVCYQIPSTLAEDAGSVPIGRPIRDTRAYVLDADGAPVPVGVNGQLHIAGAGVARGYVACPDLTAERFLPDPFDPRPGERMYRTGDVARWLANGTLEFVGRVDAQVKISGHRVEPAETEAVLARHVAVLACTVAARRLTGDGDLALVAWYVTRDDAHAPTPHDLREHLRATLPPYMMPAAFVRIAAIPLTANGKVDHRVLPAPALEDRVSPAPYIAPRNATERALAETWAALLGVPRVGIMSNVFDLGATSLLVLRAMTQLRAAHGLEVPAVRFFEHPTVETLAAHLTDTPGKTTKPALGGPPGAGAARPALVAIVGMAARYPGAPDVDTFWRNLRDGVDSIKHFTPEELGATGIDAALLADPSYVRARGVLANVDCFDAAFFGLSPREAQLMDPQQRIFLELAWEALEHAGCDPERPAGPIGVFGGVHVNSYAATVLARRPDVVERYGAFNAMLLNEKDYVATRTAYALGLTGPAISVHTACSTSLVAICQAVQSLRASQCDVAIAGAVSLTLPTTSGHLYLEGGMLSADGRTRPFDAQSSGTVFSDGAGIVVLKRLDDALRDGDTIHAVVRGVGLSNDGARKASFTAPSVRGQAAAIALAHTDAGISPRAISYVEAHGTATPLGDPIELQALSDVFRAGTEDTGFCGLGSVKSNIGHAVAAAGAAGVIKVALAMQHELLPASLHFTAPNPHLALADSAFIVTATAKPWSHTSTPRMAGISSFGVGGTNAHVVLEEAPVLRPKAPGHAAQLLVLSARSVHALGAATARLAAHLRANPEANLGDVAYTLQVGRRAFAHRYAVVAATTAGAAGVLADQQSAGVHTRHAGAVPAVIFAFPGQGAQYARMGAELYAQEPVFRAAFDRCAVIGNPLLGLDLRAALDGAGDGPLAEESGAAALRETSLAQPALYATSYALACLWQSLGVCPRALIGHSVGEFVAGALAGVFSPEDGMRLVVARGQLMQGLPAGSMLSVRVAAATLAPRLMGMLGIAAENAPSSCVVAGPTNEVALLQAGLEADGVACRLLHTSHAFHSGMMDPAVEPFAMLVRTVPLGNPAIPFVSTVTGDWITDAEAQDPEYWAGHLRATVRFGSGVRTIWAESPALMLEVGPRGTLSALARQQVVDRASQACVASLGETGTPVGEREALLRAVAQLWTRGVVIDWSALSRGEPRRRVPLPTYPFDRHRYWVDALDRPPAALEPVTVAGPVVCASDPAVPPPQSTLAPITPPLMTAMASMPSRRDTLMPALRDVLEQVSGLEVGPEHAGTSFVEMGFDSLVLTQVALALSKAHGVKITFRQLLEEHASLDLLASYLDAMLPPPPLAPALNDSASGSASGSAGQNHTVANGPLMNGLQNGTAHDAMSAVSALPGSTSAPVRSTVELLMERQLEIMAQQLMLLGAGAPMAMAAPPIAMGAAPDARQGGAPTPAADGAPSHPSVGAGRQLYDATRAFGAAARIIVVRAPELTPRQQARFDAFVRRYTARTATSKRYAAQHRATMADPRVVTGFRPATKELVYPLVMERSTGSRMWDVDGNEYVDVLSGFGSNFFGWSAPFIVDAIRAQLDVGYDVGPQHPLAGEVAGLFAEVTGTERVGFCNTGSEAVLGAIRIARTVTGRGTIVIFTGSYHGINDEVIVRATRGPRAAPAAPGIMASSAENVIVLEYGSDAALATIRELGADIAAVVVEPVQSRRPDFQPRAFLHALRALTTELGIVYVWDEIVTGFRVAPGGAQEHFGVRADLATFGKIVGGGLPIGVIAGRREFMDALDGGSWQYGDMSTPEVGVTYFAGTFVRHPLALAAAKAVLLHVREQGPALQRGVTARATRLADELNAFFRETGAPLEIRHFASIWKAFYTAEHTHGDLLFYMLRDRGVHIYDGFPCFLTTAHSDADVDYVVAAFKESVVEMRESGFLGAVAPDTIGSVREQFDAEAPPVPGARLGRNRDGTPAWFVPDLDKPGKFVVVPS